MFGRRLVSSHQAQVLAERARFMRFSPTRGEEWLHDAARDRALGGLGWHVLRVTEQHVISDLDSVVQRIVAAARALPAVGGRTLRG